MTLYGPNLSAIKEGNLKPHEQKSVSEMGARGLQNDPFAYIRPKILAPSTISYVLVSNVYIQGSTRLAYDSLSIAIE